MKCLWLMPAILAAACASQTQGEVIELDWQLEADAAANRDFVTDTGWQVHLEDAQIAIEAVAALAPERETVDALATLGRFFVPVAHAHGGHDEATGRRVRADWTAPLVFDALNDDVVQLGTLPAEAGSVELFKLEIARASSKATEALHGHQAYLRGRAERDGEVVEFEGGLDVDDKEATRRVEARVDFELGAGGTITLDLRVVEWLRDASFERLPPGPRDEPAAITRDNQVGRAWFIGARSPAAFDVRYHSEK